MSVGVRSQRLTHVGPNAIDVNVQLVLGARISGVDGQAEPVAGQNAARALFDEGPRAPRVGEIVRRVGGQDLRAFDPRDALGGDQQELGRADQVLEHRIAARFAAVEVDQRARGGVIVVPLIGHALAVHDGPQRIWVGNRLRREDRRREDGRERARGPSQPGLSRHGRAARPGRVD